MGDEMLYQIFLDEEVEDLQIMLLHIGIDGLMMEFESWLFKAGLMDREMVTDFREKRKIT